MAISKNNVLKVAELARLPLTDEELNLFSHQLSEVVNYFNELNEIDTESINPTHQTTGLADVLRDDVIDDRRSLSVDAATSQATNVYNDLFVVPRLIDDK